MVFCFIFMFDAGVYVGLAFEVCVLGFVLVWCVEVYRVRFVFERLTF